HQRRREERPMTMSERVREPAQEPDEHPRIASQADQSLPRVAAEPCAPQQRDCKHKICDEWCSTRQLPRTPDRGTPPLLAEPIPINPSVGRTLRASDPR